MPLHTRILIGLLVGAGLGATARAVLGPDAPALQWTIANVTDPIGQLFLRVLLMAVVPLVFSSLVVGTAGLGDIRRLGRVGVKMLAYSVVVSAVAVVIGLTLANVIRPGRVSADVRDELQTRFESEATRVQAAAALPTDSVPMMIVRSLVPANPIESMARPTPDILGVMFFAVVFGIALMLVTEAASAPVVQFFSGVFAAVSKIIDMVMKFAPIGVASLLFTMAARFGIEILLSLGWFVVTVLTGLALHVVLVYTIGLRLTGVSPAEFFRRIKTVVLTAFSTSSSNATLPTALRVSEANLGVPREVGSFVLTVGATANQNGTALYEGVAVLFLAQVADLPLTVGQQFVVVYLAILGGIGTAGVPSGSLPFLAAILATLGLNPALIAIIIGVDRLLDMCRTTVNVVGDLVGAVIVARSEGAMVLPRVAMAAPVQDHA